jgi:hypothetical protein
VVVSDPTALATFGHEARESTLEEPELNEERHRAQAQPWERYEAAVAAACKAVVTCRSDGGAFGRIVERPEYISWDVIHLAAPGQAKSAAVAWATLKRVGIIPSSG